MKQILKTKKGWFVFSYLVGMMYFLYYILWREDIDGGARFANIMLMAFAHIFTLFAGAWSENKFRGQAILREFAIFVPVFSVFIFFTPRVMGLIGGFVIFVLLGYFHTRVIRAQDVFGHLAKAKDQGEATSFSDESLKYVLWLLLSALMLFTLYWNV